MPIQEVKAFKVGQLVFPTIQEAQKEELAALFPDRTDACGYGVDDLTATIVKHADEIVAILTCQPRTKKTRSDKGKKRANKADIDLPLP